MTSHEIATRILTSKTTVLRHLAWLEHINIVAQNKKARHDYEILEKFEAGIPLQVEYDSNLLSFSNNYTNLDLAVGAVLILLCLEATRQRFGPVLPILCILCIIYTFVGRYFPGTFRTVPADWDVIIGNFSIGFSGTGLSNSFA